MNIKSGKRAIAEIIAFREAITRSVVTCGCNAALEDLEGEKEASLVKTSVRVRN